MSTIAKLISDIGHPNRQTAENAKRALLALGHEVVEPLLEALPYANEKGSWDIIGILTKMRDPRAAPIVSEYLFTDHNVLRIAAADCLGEIGHQQATEPLLTALATKRCSGALIWIVRALGQIADPRAVDPLVNVLKNADSAAVRYTVIEALGLIGDRRAIEPIREYIDDDSHHVRSRVITALERLDEGQHPPFLKLSSTTCDDTKSGKSLTLRAS